MSYGKKQRDSDDELGSLAQSARQSSLKQARGILIVIGVLTALVNLFMLFNVENEAREAIEAEKRNLGPGMVIDQAKAKEVQEMLVRMGQIVYGGATFLGIMFVALGLAVYKAPVLCTVTGLVLYVAGNAVFAILDPMNLARGAILKIIIVVALVKAVQAALAYEREVKATRDAELDERDEPLPL